MPPDCFSPQCSGSSETSQLPAVLLSVLTSEVVRGVSVVGRCPVFLAPEHNKVSVVSVSGWEDVVRILFLFHVLRIVNCVND